MLERDAGDVMWQRRQRTSRHANSTPNSHRCGRWFGDYTSRKRENRAATIKTRRMKLHETRAQAYDSILRTQTRVEMEKHGGNAVSLCHKFQVPTHRRPTATCDHMNGEGVKLPKDKDNDIPARLPRSRWTSAVRGQIEEMD